MANKAKLREILAILSPDGTNADFKAFDEGVDTLKKSLKQKIQAKTLDDVNGQLRRVKEGMSLEPLLIAIKDIDRNFDTRIREVASALAEEVSKFDELSKSEREENGNKVAESSGLVVSLRNELETLKTQKDKEMSDVIEALKGIPALRADNETTFSQIKARLDALEVPEEEEPDLITPVKERVEEVRSELISKIASTNHGDHANRNIAIGGNTSVLSRYTDVNLIAGANVTLTPVANTTSKYTDITIAATGSGGGSVAAAGQNTQIQYNDNGQFGASSTFTWNKSTSILAVGNATNPSVLSVNGPSSIMTFSGSVGIGTTSLVALLSLPAGTTAAGGISFGDATANLYRAGTGVVKTDGGLNVGTGVITGLTPVLRTSGNFDAFANLDNAGLNAIAGSGAAITETVTTGGARTILDVGNKVTWAPNSSVTTATMYGLLVDPTVNANAANVGGGFYGARINPTLTNTTGLSSVFLFGVASGGSDKFIVSSVGNIGVGTTSPTAKVTIIGNGLTTGLALQTTDSSSTAGFQVQDNGAVLALTSYGNLGGSSNINFPSGRIQLISGGAAMLYLDNGGGSARVPSNTALGWSGTTTPSAAVDTGLSRVTTSMVAVGNGVSGNAAGTLVAGTIGINSTAPLTPLWVHVGSGQNFVARTTGAALQIGSLADDANSYTQTNLEGNPLALNFNSGANVGVGTTAPGAKLQVGNPGSVTGTFRLAGLTGGTVQMQPASIAGNWTMTLPIGAGSTGQYLQTDGNGITQWASVTAVGGSGITRAVSVITADTSAGSTPNTDYVYFANAGMTVTLPTAIGNSNQYTVKVQANASVLVAAPTGQDIDGSTSVLLDRQYTALSFTSNNSVWGVLP